MKIIFVGDLIVQVLKGLIVLSAIEFLLNNPNTYSIVFRTIEVREIRLKCLKVENLMYKIQ
ncbi:hypothetical protein C173_31084 [Paenibacillus sp. FSL R7-277]|nr:hypothetical protein C173_31084 [Paenibacillus sp. FSL R7-277]